MIVSRSLSRWQAVVLGLVILAALGLGLYGLFLVGSGHWPWERPFEVRVGFPNIQGVTTGTRVRVKGHDAGEVRTVELPGTPDGKVLLTLRLDRRFRDLV